jgi:hypothetical protein
MVGRKEANVVGVIVVCLPLRMPSFIVRYLRFNLHVNTILHTYTSVGKEYTSFNLRRYITSPTGWAAVGVLKNLTSYCLCCLLGATPKRIPSIPYGITALSKGMLSISDMEQRKCPAVTRHRHLP